MGTLVLLVHLQQPLGRLVRQFMALLTIRVQLLVSGFEQFQSALYLLSGGQGRHICKLYGVRMALVSCLLLCTPEQVLTMP